MNCFKRFFTKNDKQTKEVIDWEERYIILSESLKKYNVKFPVIMFCNVTSDLNVYFNSRDLIYDSALNHWGFGVKDELELIIDSKGSTFEIIHNMYDESTNIYFSYPTIKSGKITIEELKERINHGFEDFEIDEKLKKLNSIQTFEEIYKFIDRELKIKGILN